MSEQPKRDRLPHIRVWLAPEGECKFCDDRRRDGDDFFPPHDASERCESGRHSHCTCDTCF